MKTLQSDSGKDLRGCPKRSEILGKNEHGATNSRCKLVPILRRRESVKIVSIVFVLVT